MSKRDGRLHLMELLGRAGEKYVLEADYSEQELAKLKASGADVPVGAEIRGTSENAEMAGWPAFGADQGETDPKEDVDSTPKVEKIPVVRIIMGVALVAAAILLVVFFWHPDRTDVISTTESSVEETTTDDGTLKIDEAHFPDAYFREYIQSQFDANEDGILDEGEIASVKEIDLDTYEARTSIRSLAGIEYLTKLERLVCPAFVTELDVSKNEALRSLSCRYGSLHALDVSANTRLTELDCSGNDLGTLDVSKNDALITLRCSGCGLTELDVRNNMVLTELNCSDNRISEIDTSRNKLLFALHCQGNAISTMDVRNNPQLESFSCDPSVLVGRNDDEFEHVRLTERNFSNASFWEDLKVYDKDNNEELDESEIAEIKVLYLSNMLDTINGSFGSLRFFTEVEEVYWQSEYIIPEVLTYFPKLRILDISFSNIGSLDLSPFTELEELRCISSSLSELDVSRNTKLQVLYCENNALTSLNVSQNEALAAVICDPDVEVVGMRDVKQNDDANGIPVDVAHFPNGTLREYVAETLDTNRDGVLDSQEIQDVTELTMEEWNGHDIYSLRGIEYFTNLRSLDCRNCAIVHLDVSHNTSLVRLNCSSCRLLSLELSHNPLLEELDCSINCLTSLDVSHNPALKALDCESNDLGSLDVSHNPALERLYVRTYAPGELAELDVSHNPVLKELHVISDTLTTLDVSHNPMLEDLEVDVWNLVELDVSHNPALKVLTVDASSLARLDVSHNPALMEFSCSGNELTSLDVSHNPALIGLDCSLNELTSLDVSHNPLLEYLICNLNPLDKLDLSANPNLLTVGVDSTVDVIGAREDCFISPY